MAGFAAVDAAVVPPEVGVAAAVFLGFEGEDGDRGLFAVAVREAQVFYCGFRAAVGAGADVTAGEHLCW